MARIIPGLRARILRLSALAALATTACAAPHTDASPAPGTSRTAADSAPPSDPVADGEVTGESEPAPEAARRAPPVRPPSPPPVRPAPSSPYRVELLGDSSDRLATYRHAGRTYVLGTIGSRYQIHVVNPTARRVEAVVSVDGLDAIDGATADFVSKSGYVIPAYGDVTIDGFRTSMRDVATFRFSSVRDSYAAREGSDRDVGVIGVAFFPERDRPPPPRLAPRPASPAPPAYDRSYPAPSPEAPMAPSGAGGARAAESSADTASAAPPAAAPAPKRERSGLGTEFGEERYSAVEYTEFQRADARHPSSVLELRYNDRPGLIALGIPLTPRRPSPSEVELRETASPFPANGFATPPPPRD